MMDALAEHGFLVFVVVAVVMATIGWIFSSWSQDRAAANFQRLATQLGLEFVPVSADSVKPMRVVGKLRGKEVQISNYSNNLAGDGLDRKSSTTWSEVTAQVGAPFFSFTFTLQKRDVGTKVSELFGTQEATVGDAEFDKVWFMQTSHPKFLRAVLLPELRAKLMAVRQAGANDKFELKEGEVRYVERGSFSDAERSQRFAALADVVSNLAEVAAVVVERTDLV
jgi:hypothetical protein